MRLINTYFPFLLVLLVLCVAESIIYPIGEFALNDDFAYARSVYIWHKTGEFQIGAWPAMSLFSHSLLGLFFVKLFGFSYAVLRLSNIVFCLITLFFLYNFFLKFQRPFSAALVCAFIVFNPYYMNIFNSFMTDLTFFNYSFLSFYFLHNYYTHKRFLNLLLFFLLAMLSILVRQFGVLLLLAFVAVSVLEYVKYRRKLNIFISSGLLLLGLSVLYLFEKNVFNIRTGHNYQGVFVSGSTLNLDDNLGWKVLEKTILFLKFSGSILILLLVLNFSALKQRLIKSNKPMLFVGMFFFLLLLAIVDHKEITGHLVINFGLGIESTVDRLYIGTNVLHGSNNTLYYSLIGLFIIGYILFALWLSSVQVSLLYNSSPQKQFIVLVCIGYLLLLGIAETAFDRYCMFIAFFIVIYFMMDTIHFSKPSILLSVFILFLIGGFSTLATKDYFVAARLKQRIKTELITNQGVKDFELNASAEHVFWDGTENEFNWVSWDHFNDKNYLVTRGPLKNFTLFKAYTYKRYMPFCIDTFYVLKKRP